MGLRQTAETDAGIILNDCTYGFGFPIKVQDPSGKIGLLTGFSNDISQIIDVETGQAVSGRIASVVLHIKDLICKGLELPVGIADAASKPWIIEFKDLQGLNTKFKVSESNPDRSLGIVVCLLELYK